MTLSFYEIIYFFKISLPYLRGKRHLKSFEPAAARSTFGQTAQLSLTHIRHQSQSIRRREHFASFVQIAAKTDNSVLVTGHRQNLAIGQILLIKKSKHF
jgi:hypothetical protein